MVTPEQLDKIIKQMEKLDVATTASSSYLQTITGFSDWSTNNAKNIAENIEKNISDNIDDMETYLKEITEIFEDFVKSNEHIIERIKKVKKKM